jgi:PIN domain nuclease of toxin-antitoxin system
MNYTLDACALLAFLNDEAGSEIVEGLLDKSRSGEYSLHISIVNLLEVYYAELRDKGEEIADIVLDAVRYYSVYIIDTISEPVFREAARLKTTYKMSLGDAIGLATAAELQAQFVSSDHHELESVEKQEPGRLFWFR